VNNEITTIHNKLPRCNPSVIKNKTALSAITPNNAFSIAALLYFLVFINTMIEHTAVTKPIKNGIVLGLCMNTYEVVTTDNEMAKNRLNLHVKTNLALSEKLL